MATKRVVTSCTRDCPSGCGLVAHVTDGRLTRLSGNPDHPVTRGAICAKTARYHNRVYSPERVTTPLLRTGSGFAPVSWDEALDLMAHTLAATIAASGPEAILHYQGFGERTALKLLNGRFFAHLGGVTTLAGTLCGGTAYAALKQDFGARISHDPLDHLNSRTIILWGKNPAAAQRGLVPILKQARRQGAAIWLVDPVQSESMPLAHRHIQLRPGADVYLALGAAKAALSLGLADRHFAAEHGNHFLAFLALLDRFSTEELAALAGVPLADLEDLARAMAENAPAAVLLGWGMHRYTLAHQGVRAVSALSALTGNIGRPGGGVSQGFEEYGPYDQSVWGEGLHPPRRKLLMPRVGREILAAHSPPIRAVVVSAANPLCMAPNAALVAKAFKQAGFVVYMGHFMDDTADAADLVLPCATFLEETDVVASYGHNVLGPVNKAIEPVGQCRSQFDIYQALAARFPFAPQYVRPLEDWLADICRPFTDKGPSLAQVMAGPVRDPAAPMVPFGDHVFQTASGRFEFMTDISIRPQSDPAYPLTLLTTASPDHLCSELTLTEHAPLPVARVHPDTALVLGVADNRPARLATPLGEVTVLVRLDAALRRDVCLCRRGGWMKAGHGLNRLIADEVSALGQGTPYYQARATLAPPARERAALGPPVPPGGGLV